MVRVQSLASVTVLCSWTRHLTLTVWFCAYVPRHAVRTVTIDQAICNGSKTIPKQRQDNGYSLGVPIFEYCSPLTVPFSTCTYV